MGIREAYQSMAEFYPEFVEQVRQSCDMQDPDTCSDEQLLGHAAILALYGMSAEVRPDPRALSAVNEAIAHVAQGEPVGDTSAQAMDQALNDAIDLI